MSSGGRRQASDAALQPCDDAGDALEPQADQRLLLVFPEQLLMPVMFVSAVSRMENCRVLVLCAAGRGLEPNASFWPTKSCPEIAASRKVVYLLFPFFHFNEVTTRSVDRDVTEDPTFQRANSPCRSDLHSIRNKIAVHESTAAVSTLTRRGLSVPAFWTVKVGTAQIHLGRLLADISSHHCFTAHRLLLLLSLRFDIFHS